MDFNRCRTDLPVLMLHNVDPSWPETQIQEYLTETRTLVDAMVALGHPIQELCIQSANLSSSLEGIDPDETLVFNWCEELPGEPHSEYRVAEILERLGFTFTGASANALRLDQDKRRVKRTLQRCGIPTPAWKVYLAGDPVEWNRYPAIVKPALEHGGYGITRESVVQSPAELVRRVQYVTREMKEPAVVEDFIDGREFHVGVVGNHTLHVLPPAEIDYSQFDDIHDRLCTYESNFDESSRAYQLTLPKIPVPMDADLLEQMNVVVLAAYRATGCRDYARMDLRLQDGIFYVLDVNHNADISSGNSLIKAARLVGLSYGAFGSLLINLAAQRHPKFSIDLMPGVCKCT